MEHKQATVQQVISKMKKHAKPTLSDVLNAALIIEIILPELAFEIRLEIFEVDLPSQ